MEDPVFSDDSTELTLDADDDQSATPIKGAIKWERRESEHVFLWWQTPFYVATPNGGYSMTEQLFESMPSHTDTVWVVDEECGVLRRFPLSYWGDDSVREVIDPDDGRFNNVSPERQFAVDTQKCVEQHDLEDFQPLY